MKIIPFRKLYGIKGLPNRYFTETIRWVPLKFVTARRRKYSKQTETATKKYLCQRTSVFFWELLLAKGTNDKSSWLSFNGQGVGCSRYRIKTIVNYELYSPVDFRQVGEPVFSFSDIVHSLNGICYLCYNSTNPWNSLRINNKRITPFFFLDFVKL